MSKLKLLAILPYEGLQTLFQDAVRQREDVEVDCYVGDMDKGVQLALAHEKEGYFAIVSRAGTAELISRASTLPVIDIRLTVSDMLRAIRLAQSYAGKFAVVGFPQIIGCAETICDMLQYRVSVIAVNAAEQITPRLEALRAEGFSLIVGDVITTNLAKRVGFNTILVTSSLESVEGALDEAAHWHRNFAKLKRESELSRQVFEACPDAVFVCSADGSVRYANEAAYRQMPSALAEKLVECVRAVCENDRVQLLKRIGDRAWTVAGKRIAHDKREAAVFYVRPCPDLCKIDQMALAYQSGNRIPTVNFDTFNSESPALRELIAASKRFARANTPVLILGEKGTGKDSLAYTIYRNSPYSANTFLTVDCKWMTDKTWQLLLDGEDSALTRTGYTVYFKNLHLLSPAQQDLLETYMHNTSVHKRNRLLFSYIPGRAAAFEQSAFLYYLHNVLGAPALTIPPLNARKEDIPLIASLYLNEINTQLGKQVMGLQPDALQALQQFDWQCNIDQFKRVMKELVILTATSYISGKTARTVLQNEHYVNAPASVETLNLHGTFEEITKNILRIVLEQENMNQSKAAKRLGISRSTFWRKMHEA